MYAWAMVFAILPAFCHVSAAGESLAAASGVEGIEWRLVEVGSTILSPTAGDRQPQVRFDPAQKKVTGFAGCNTFFGSYELDGSALRFGPIGSTRMSCPDLAMGLETDLLKALDKTRAWEIQDGRLLLLDDSGVLARFSEAVRSEISGAVWQWVQTRYNDDRKAAPDDPVKYTVQFKADGTVSVTADCNQKGGTYSTAQQSLSIEITHSTMAACPPGSLEEDFVRGLSAAAIYFMQDGDLFIDLKYDTGTMRFSRRTGQ